MSIETDNLLNLDDLKLEDIERAPPASPSSTPSRTAPRVNGSTQPNAAERLRNLARLRDERKALYGDNYIRAGYAMAFMLGKVELRTPRDYIRIGLLVQEFSKLSRYSVQWEKGHGDSLDDLSVYAQILQEVDAMTEDDLGKHIAKSLWEK
jgi:hypothetical protein